MRNNENDPFHSTFSLLAGRGTSSHRDYPLNHIEPMPDSEPTDEKPAVSKAPRAIALIGMLLALLHLG
jgi:hypothetical protein